MHVDIQQQPSARQRRQWQPGLAEQVMDSFAAINRTKTGGDAPTHQRASLRALGPNLGPMHLSEDIATSKINWFASSRHRFAHSARQVDRVCTRALSRPLALLEADARASRARRDAEATRNPAKRRAKRTRRVRGVGRKTWRPLDTRPHPPTQRRPFRNLGRPGFKKLGN